MFHEQGTSEQENTAAVALSDAAVWSRSCHPSGTFHPSCHADFFGVELEWKAPDGWYKRDQTPTPMGRLGVMQDGRLAYF